ncbi:MAG: hypothetical protein ABIR51_00815 [Sphingomicrobium sp.]
MTRPAKSRDQFVAEALAAAGLRARPEPVEVAPNLRNFILDDDYACRLLRSDAPSMLPNFPRMRLPVVVPGPDGMTGPERLGVTGRRKASE